MAALIEVLQSNPFYEMVALLGLAAGLGYLGLLFRQPMIVSFIFVGILVGPAGIGLVKSHASIELLSELGIALLLFLVGLKLDFKLIKTLGAVSLATGLGQVFFTSFIGFFIGIGFGYDYITSLYIAVALTFSSTIIIIKILSDKKEVDTLHGKIAVGFLIVQDLVVVLAMMVLSGINIKVTGEAGSTRTLLDTMIASAAFLFSAFLFTKYLATHLMSRVVRSSELIIVFSIAWAGILAVMADYLGFGKELGGLLAGMTLASTPFREAIVSRMSSLRDFLLLFFFIALGSRLDLNPSQFQLGPAITYSLFVLIGNPIIVMIIMGLMGYRKRTSFLAGLTVAQISEFSLIFVAMGLSIGHLEKETVGLVTIVGLITIALSVYMITYSAVLYRWFEPLLNIFEKKNPSAEIKKEQTKEAEIQYQVIVFGLGRLGLSLARELSSHNIRGLGVDFNPEVVKKCQIPQFDVQYGDACDQEFLHSIPFAEAKWVVLAMAEHEWGVTHEDSRLVLIDGLRREGFQGKVAVATHSHSHIETLKQKGADLVFLPYEDAARKLMNQIV